MVLQKSRHIGMSKDFSSIPKKDLKKILSRIKTLTEDPRPQGSEKLTGQQRYRLRRGRYRMLYSIKADELTLLSQITHLCMTVSILCFRRLSVNPRTRSKSTGRPCNFSRSCFIMAVMNRFGASVSKRMFRSLSGMAPPGAKDPKSHSRYIWPYI
jgi:mRNA interferase RelE/StbE